jgi:hypothetical protein
MRHREHSLDLLRVPNPWLQVRGEVEPSRSGHLVEEGGYVGKSVREVSAISGVVRRGRAGVLDLYRLL